MIEDETKKINNNVYSPNVINTSWFGPVDLTNILMGIYNSKMNSFFSNKYWGLYKEYDYQTIYDCVSTNYSLRVKASLNGSGFLKEK